MKKFLIALFLSFFLATSSMASTPFWDSRNVDSVKTILMQEAENFMTENLPDLGNVEIWQVLPGVAEHFTNDLEILKRKKAIASYDLSFSVAEGSRTIIAICSFRLRPDTPVVGIKIRMTFVEETVNEDREA